MSKEVFYRIQIGTPTRRSGMSVLVDKVVMVTADETMSDDEIRYATKSRYEDSYSGLCVQASKITDIDEIGVAKKEYKTKDAGPVERDKNRIVSVTRDYSYQTEEEQKLADTYLEHRNIATEAKKRLYEAMKKRIEYDKPVRLEMNDVEIKGGRIERVKAIFKEYVFIEQES